MKKILCIALLAGIFSLSAAAPAEAWIIAKLSNIAQDATTAISKYGKQVQNELGKVGDWGVVKTLGKGFKEARDWTKENVSKLKDFAEQAKEQADAIKGAVDEVKNSNLAKIKTITDDINAIKNRAETIKSEIEEISDSVQSTYDVAMAEADGKVNTLTDNMSRLEKMMAEDPEQKETYQQQYDEMKAEKEDYERQKKELVKTAKSAISSATAVKNQELKGLTKDIDKLMQDLAIISGMTGDEQSAEEALANTANLYFLQFDEELDPQRQDIIRRNRLMERRRSIIAAYSESLKFIPDIVTKDNEGEDQGYAASTFDTVSGAWGADADLKIKNMLALRDYARLLTYDLKMQTANQMSVLTFYKLKKPQKNISEFNLDDYVYTPKRSK